MSGRKFTELNAGTVGANSIFAQAQAPVTPGDPYTSTKVSATDVGNFVNGTQAYADIGNVTPLAAIAALQQGGASTANANIADEYDSSHTYNTGDRVIYEGVLKVCNDDNVTGAWDSTKWDSATVDEIISALKVQDLDNVTLTTSDNNKLLGVSVSGSDISVGAVDNGCSFFETEMLVGTWINGKPLYKKVIKLLSKTIPSGSIQEGISSLGATLAFFDHCIMKDNYGNYLALPYLSSMANTDISCYISANFGTLYITHGSYWENKVCDFYITILYTKT